MEDKQTKLRRFRSILWGLSGASLIISFLFEPQMNDVVSLVGTIIMMLLLLGVFGVELWIWRYKKEKGANVPEASAIHPNRISMKFLLATLYDYHRAIVLIAFLAYTVCMTIHNILLDLNNYGVNIGYALVVGLYLGVEFPNRLANVLDSSK